MAPGLPRSLPGTRTLWNVRIPMRDGVELAADVHLPAGGLDGGPYPVILTRDPYNRQTAALTYRARYYTEHGYVMVNQDCRGRFDSDGEFYPFLLEGPDGYDSIEWLAAQEWCTGRIGMMGASYAGSTQWMAAKERPPHLTTLASAAAAGKHMRELPWDNGGVSLVMFSWLYMMHGRSQHDPSLVDWSRVFTHLPLRTLDRAMGKELQHWQDWIGHHLLDDYWRQGLLDDVFADLDLPVLHMTGWFDGDQPGQIYFWEGMKRSRNPELQQLVVGPWAHSQVVVPSARLMDMDFGASSVLDMYELQLRWFDRWLKDEPNGIEDEPPVRYFFTGRKEWRESSAWPPPDAVETRLHLRSGGNANTLLGDGVLSFEAASGDEPADVYRYDPASLADQADTNPFSRENAGNLAIGTADQRSLHLRDDVLVYTSQPLMEDLAVAGQPVVVLQVSSDCPDTDWVVAITDVAPSGKTNPIQPPYSGRFRARFREGFERETFMTPGEIYEVRITVGDVAHVFEAGHRVRLTVRSWDFPAFSRNLNTDESIADGTTIRVATNRVHHGRSTPAYVVLPTQQL